MSDLPLVSDVNLFGYGAALHVVDFECLHASKAAASSLAKEASSDGRGMTIIRHRPQLHVRPLAFVAPGFQNKTR
jgi:hypothetical protein